MDLESVPTLGNLIVFVVVGGCRGGNLGVEGEIPDLVRRCSSMVVLSEGRRERSQFMVLCREIQWSS